jgi:hypothetical protein
MKHAAIRLTALAAALGLLTTLSAAPALGQAEPPQYEPPQQSKEQISEAKIDQFVTALNEVHTIRNDVATELESTQDAEQAQKVQQRAQQDMIEAVQDAGLSVEEYNQIASRMSSDPELQARISAKLDESS